MEFIKSSSWGSSPTLVWRPQFAYGAELGYEVTVVKDATASYSEDHKHAALEITIPNYASAIVTADEIVAAISPLVHGKGRRRVLIPASLTNSGNAPQS